MVNPDLPVHSATEFIELARKDPGKINYACASVGSVSHVSTELFASMAGIKLTRVLIAGPDRR